MKIQDYCWSGHDVLPRGKKSLGQLIGLLRAVSVIRGTWGWKGYIFITLETWSKSVLYKTLIMIVHYFFLISVPFLVEQPNRTLLGVFASLYGTDLLMQLVVRR